MDEDKRSFWLSQEKWDVFYRVSGTFVVWFVFLMKWYIHTDCNAAVSYHFTLFAFIVLLQMTDEKLKVILLSLYSQTPNTMGSALLLVS